LDAARTRELVGPDEDGATTASTRQARPDDTLTGSAATAQREVVQNRVGERIASHASDDPRPIGGTVRAPAHATSPVVATTTATRLETDAASGAVGHVAASGVRGAVTHVGDTLALLGAQGGGLIQPRAGQP